MVECKMKMNKERLFSLLIDSILHPKGWPAGEGAGVLEFDLIREELRRPDRILIIQLTSIGDVVMATPLIEALRNRYPGAYIAFLVDEPSYDVVSGNPFLDEAIQFDEYRYIDEIKSKKKGINEVCRELFLFVDGLRRKGFDLVVNLHLSKRSAILTRLIMERDAIGLLINDEGRLFLRGNLWIYYHYLRIFSKRGLDPINRWSHQVELNLRIAGLRPQRPRTYIRIEHSDLDGDLFGLCPGANWKTKRWPIERFARLGDLIWERYSLRPLILGGKDDIGIAKKMKGLMVSNPIDLVGRLSLKGLGGVLSRCRFLVSNDTGPIHIAGAVNIPTISICGPSFYGPYGEGHIILQASIPCRSCGRTGCNDQRCMDLIGVDAIMTTVKILLSLKNGEFSKARRLVNHPSLNGIDIYYSGKGPLTKLFSYLPLRVDSRAMGEKVLEWAHMVFWEYLNQKMCKVVEGSISIDQIISEINRHPFLKKKGLKKWIKGIISELEDMERLCQRAEMLSLELYKEKKKGEVIQALSLIDEKIESFGRLGRMITFLGILPYKKTPSHNREKRIVEDNLVGYHIKKEACLFMQKTLEEVIIRL